MIATDLTRPAIPAVVVNCRGSGIDLLTVGWHAWSYEGTEGDLHINAGWIHWFSYTVPAILDPQTRTKDAPIDFSWGLPHNAPRQPAWPESFIIGQDGHDATRGAYYLCKLRCQLLSSWLFHCLDGPPRYPLTCAVPYREPFPRKASYQFAFVGGPRSKLPAVLLGLPLDTLGSVINDIVKSTLKTNINRAISDVGVLTDDWKGSYI